MDLLSGFCELFEPDCLKRFNLELNCFSPNNLVIYKLTSHCLNVNCLSKNFFRLDYVALVRKLKAKAMPQIRMLEKLPDLPPPMNVATAIAAKRLVQRGAGVEPLAGVQTHTPLPQLSRSHNRWVSLPQFTDPHLLLFGEAHGNPLFVISCFVDEDGIDR